MTVIVLRPMFVKSFAITVLFLAVLTGEFRPVYAQSDSPTSSARGRGGDAVGQRSDLRFALESHSRFGAIPFVPGQWCDLHLRLENTGAASHDLLCTSYFETAVDLQYGRQVWIPPHARLTLPHPALIPQPAQDKATSINVSSLVIERTAGVEVLLKSDSDQLRHDRTLVLTPPLRITGIVFGGSGKDEVLQEVIDIVVACRVTQMLSNKVTILADDFLPTDENSLRYLDHLVLADNRLLDDYAALAAVRRWLHRGGRLWVMLDRVDSEMLERLLGDDFPGHVVDRVGLTSVRIDVPPTLEKPEGEAGETLNFDQPVDMARLEASGMKVHNTVDGWPAALSKPYGEGRILITTVGSRAWIEPATANEALASDPLLKSVYQPRTPMQYLSTMILGRREAPLLATADVESLAREYISYKIPRSTVIVSAIGGLLVSLLVVGGLLWWSQRLEHFGWSGSLLSILASLVLVGIGQTSRQGVPPTEASFQFAQAISGTDDERSQASVAIYRPEPAQAPIETRQGGVISTDMKRMDGVTLRMITTDLLTFHLEGLPQPSGLQLFSESSSHSNSPPYAARATFNDQGLLGRFTGMSDGGTDVLLATRFGRVGVEMLADGTWKGGISDIFAADQYLAANFLGTEQERRRRILEMLFSRKNWKNVLQQPQLLVWLQERPQGFTFGEGLTRRGQTLLVLPVDFTRPPVGTSMQIPAPLISYGTVRPPDGSLPIGCWDDNLGEWQQRNSPCTTWLSFQIPPALLPAKALKALLSIKVSGAIGRVEVLSYQNNAAVSLEKLPNPIGTVQVEIPDASALNLTEEGQLVIGINAGNSDQTAAGSGLATSPQRNASDYWKIESLGLSVWAKTTDKMENE